MPQSLDIRLKRVYLPPEADDGRRILVERLWPRGLTKEKAAIEVWMKDISPSPELRKWYGHVPARWPEFQRRYRAELEGDQQTALLAQLHDIASKERVTLVYAAKDEARNSALIVQEVLLGR